MAASMIAVFWRGGLPLAAAVLLAVTAAAPHDAWAARQKRKQAPAAEQAAPEGVSDEDAIVYGETQKKISPEKFRSMITVAGDVQMKTTLGQKIDQAIAQLVDIIVKHPSPFTLRRLAELYWEKSKHLHAENMEEFNARMEAWINGGRKGKEPKPELDSPKIYNRQAVTVCELILQEYPTFQAMDEVYFFMGYNLTELDRGEEAVRYYKKITTDYPNSQYLAKTWLNIGEYYFDKNNVYEAKPAYEEAAKFKDAPTYGYAAYKIAWCWYNLGDYEQSIERFQEVVQWSDEAAKKDKGKIQLKEESLKDLVMAYAELGGEDVEKRAEVYFKKVGGDKYFVMMLERLTEIYFKQGKLDQSIRVFKRLIGMNPVNPKNHLYQDKIVEAYSNMNDRPNTLKAILELVEYAKPESAWVKANKDQRPDDVEEAWLTSERRLIKQVVEYHKEARKTKAEATYQISQELYETYIKYFDKSKTLYDVRFNYAELLSERGKHEQAANEYKGVAAMDPKGRHFEEASYSAIQSFELLLRERQAKVEKEVQERINRKRNVGVKDDAALAAQEENQFARIEMPNLEQGFIESCNLYIQGIPDSKYLVDIIYKTGTMYYTFNQFPEAVEKFELIITRYPDHRLAKYSANLILDSLNIARDWPKLRDTSKAYLDNPKLVKTPKYRAELFALYERASFKALTDVYERKEYKPAADGFVAFVKEFGKSEVRDKALFNAADAYVQAGQIREAIEVRKELLANKDYAKSDVIPDTKFLLGKNYEALAYYDQATKEYLEYIAAYEGKKEGRHVTEATWNASVFLENAGKLKESIDLKQKYVAILKADREANRQDEIDEIQYTLGFTYLDRRMFKEAQEAFSKYLEQHKERVSLPKVKKDPKSGTVEVAGRAVVKGDPNRIFMAHYQLATIYKLQGQKEKLAEEYQTILLLANGSLEKPLVEGGEAVGEAMIFNLEPQLQAYNAIDLSVGGPSWIDPEDRVRQEKWNKLLAEKLNMKAAKAQELQAKYEEVSKLKNPIWTVAALFKMGEIYKNFGLAMFNAPLPPWFDNPDQEFIYRDALNQKVQPLENKAITYYTKSVETAYEKGVFSEYANLAIQELRGYRPAEWPEVNEVRLDPGMTTDGLFFDDFRRELNKAAPAPAASAAAASASDRV